MFLMLSPCQEINIFTMDGQGVCLKKQLKPIKGAVFLVNNMLIIFVKENLVVGMKWQAIMMASIRI